jgi:hypothetical protein
VLRMGGCRIRRVYDGSILLGWDSDMSCQRRRSCLERMGRLRLREAKIVRDGQWDSADGHMELFVPLRRQCGGEGGQSTFPARTFDRRRERHARG